MSACALRCDSATTLSVFVPWTFTSFYLEYAPVLLIVVCPNRYDLFMIF